MTAFPYESSKARVKPIAHYLQGLTGGGRHWWSNTVPSSPPQLPDAVTPPSPPTMDVTEEAPLVVELGQPPDPEWKYADRREMQEIVRNLFLGPYSVAVRSRSNYLEEKGITHIVCIRQDCESHIVRTHFSNKIQYLVLNIADQVTENIIQHFQKVRRFLDECFAAGGKVLVHGNAGISRSAAIVCGYIMEKYNLSFKDAFSLVQSKRFCVSINEGFIQQLKEYEPIYQARNLALNGQCSMREESVWKRKREGSLDKNSMTE